MYRLKRMFTILMLVTLMVSACQPLVLPDGSTVIVQPPQANQALPAGGAIAKVNDIEMYYEVHGAGEPLILLHGGFGNTENFANSIPVFAKEFRVIAVDSRGQGRTSDSGQPLSYSLMVSDVVGIMDVLHIAKAHIVGWSDGGIIGLGLALHHPDRVMKLVTDAPNFTPEGITAEFHDFVQNATYEQWDEIVGADYRRLSPDPEHLPVMVEKCRAMWLTQPNFTQEELRSIHAPTLVIDGANDDLIRVDHVTELAKLIPNAKLVLLADTGHFAPVEKTDEWNKAILTFLED
jgi:pimeloyl-ACP methyl ester carboxylesterase